MKISNSKKQLAEIISENGGWRDGAEFAAQDRYDMGVDFYARQPRRDAGDNFWHLPGRWYSEAKLRAGALVTNWHQTLLSRDEYFHLYPVPVEVVVENKTACHLTVTDKPTLEQLAADYRNAKDYADRKQEEADAAKADAEAKLAELVAAGKAHGLVLSVADTRLEPVINDWRDLRVGDVIECVSVCLEDNGAEMFDEDKRHHGKVCSVIGFGVGGVNHINTDIDGGLYIQDFKFIRRPAKGGANA